MLQQGQVFRLSGHTEERSVWAYRYRVGGRGSRRVQRGGFASERDASEALERALERVRRERGCGSALTLGELVDEYLAQHDGEPETIEKLRWLLTKPVKVFGTRRLPELRSQEIAAWRMTIPPGHRFEATQALRQVLARAVVWGMIDVNPAKQGVDNPQRRYTEKRPFESGAALAALDQLPAGIGSALLFPSPRGGHLDLHNFRNRDWKPAQHAAGITPLRRVYDLRHTFATFALRAGISTFDLSRYMGASLTMIDRHYGHLARDGREHAIKLLDALNAPNLDAWTLVDARWTSKDPVGVSAENESDD